MKRTLRQIRNEMLDAALDIDSAAHDLWYHNTALHRRRFELRNETLQLLWEEFRERSQPHQA